MSFWLRLRIHSPATLLSLWLVPATWLIGLPLYALSGLLRAHPLCGQPPVWADPAQWPARAVALRLWWLAPAALAAARQFVLLAVAYRLHWCGALGLRDVLLRLQNKPRSEPRTSRSTALAPPMCNWPLLCAWPATTA